MQPQGLQSGGLMMPGDGHAGPTVATNETNAERARRSSHDVSSEFHFVLMPFP